MIYPIPSEGKFKIQGIEPGLEFKVINILGKSVMAGELESDFYLNQQTGIYFVAINKGGVVVQSEKLIIEK